jgi:hypothetical protein
LHVRLVFCLVMLLFGIGWLASAWGPVPTSEASIHEPHIEYVWRRTAQGWERVRWNDRMCIVPFEPSLHPSVVALFEVLAALTIGAYCWSRQTEAPSSQHENAPSRAPHPPQSVC